MLDQRLTASTLYVLVAQHAVAEAGVIRHQPEHCPTLERADLHEAIPLAKHLVPNLSDCKLDTLPAQFGIRQPPDRHRAYANVDVTAQEFHRLISAAVKNPQLGGCGSGEDRGAYHRDQQARPGGLFNA
ncbi:hypothetical protein ABZ622_31360 [Streptomyces sp. NPDC007164]|uniref:hypothetical protein n=1 Tax=Streptomyces sp. NPDC007164 TaxID=3156918 RepID=UPI0033FA6834